VDFAKSAKDAEVIIGGSCDDSVGYFVHPTVIVTTNASFKTMTEEIFGPVLTVLVYPADEFEKYVGHCGFE
jgi:1-pyrroline-5-carboxylate dehydrogenase